MAEPEDKKGYDTAKILEQLRDEYWQGITEAEALQPEGGQVQLMSFWLGDEFYGFDAPFCKSVIKLPKIVRVPRTPDYLEGVINLRGQITSVVDLRKVFGLKINPLEDHARLLVIEVGDIATAVVIEKIGEIMNRPLIEMKETASGATRMKAEFVKGYFEEKTEDESEQLLIYLNLEKIFRSRELKIDYRGGPGRKA